jgi:magnesium chelatase family protein
VKESWMDKKAILVRKEWSLGPVSRSLMKNALCPMQLTIKAYHRVLKLSRTIADLAGSEAITHVHLAEVLR